MHARTRYRYQTVADTVQSSSSFPSVRFLVVGDRRSCAAPVADFAPSPATDGANANALPLAQTGAWQRPSPASIGGGRDVMGGNPAGSMSATCYYFGLELWLTQVC